MLQELGRHILDLTLTAAPWLLFGLLLAGAVQALIPEARLQRWLGGPGLGPVTRAAVIGAPLPLCSCGAIPTALSLYRSGASRGSTTAFLVGTPGIGVDSVILTWALLGPVMAILRPLGAVVTAIATGLSVGLAQPLAPTARNDPPSACGDSCCNSAGVTGWPTRLRAGLRYGMSDLLDDIAGWLVIGLVLAGIVSAVVPPDALATWGSGPVAMALFAVVGIPMYICATAATPVAAGLLLAGVSPGAVLVFLLAGPITSMATLMLLRREMGNQVVIVYLATIVICTIAVGMLTDALVATGDIDLTGQLSAGADLLPVPLQWLALAVLVLFGVRPLRRRLFGF